jgi:8-oxo-dGTP diphosphatase
MLHRIKKKIDINQGKWIGIGGKIEGGESPDECVRREVLEETGLTLQDPKLRAIVTFNFESPQPELEDWDVEYMFVYTCDRFSGKLTEICDEGVLAWVPEAEIDALPQWEGDRLFLKPILEGAPFFSMKLNYQGDSLTDYVTFGEDMVL